MARKRTPKQPPQDVEAPIDDTAIDTTRRLGKNDMQSLVETNLVSIVASKTSSDRARIDAGRELTAMFDLKRTVSQDDEAKRRVIQIEIARVRTMSDKDLGAYIQLLEGGTLDAEFERMMDAEKREMIYLAERRVEVKSVPKRGHRRKHQAES